MINLKDLAGARYRITVDESAKLDITQSARTWCYRIPCRYGHISVHGSDSLAAFTDRPKVGRRLASLAGVKVQQRGDREVTVVFSPDQLGAVTSLLKARKRRQDSDAQKARLMAISPFVPH